jgi:outer membrane lipoprotein carrier protein
MLSKLVLLLIPVVVWAEAGVFEQVKDHYQKVETFHAALTQVYHWEGFDATQSFEGEVWFSRPDRLRVRWNDGQENHLICSGDTAWLYTPALNQAILAHHPSEVVIDLFNLDRYTMVEGKEGEHILETTSEEENPYFEKITVRLDAKRLLIKEMNLTDPNGNVTDWLFDEIDFNPAISDSIFDFVPPPGTEVIEQ